jgi:nucleotide-binding universal stress UspA family protein
MKKILIGIDNSKFAEYAAAYGFNLAHQLNAEVGLIHVIEPVVAAPVASVDSSIGMPFDNTQDMILPELYHIQDEQARIIMSAAIKKAGKDIKVTPFTEYGSTGDGILECSKAFNADLIVIGTHSRTGLDRFLMGSIAEHVVRHAEIPVLVVPMKHED